MIDETDPAQQQEGVADDVTTTTDPQVEEEAAESQGDESGEGAGATQDDQGEQEAQEPVAAIEIEVEGLEPEQQPKEAAAPWVKELRKKHRTLEQENADLKRQLSAIQQPAQQVADPGEEPTLAGCGFDEAAFKEQWKGWNEATLKKQAADAERAKAVEAEQQRWQARHSTYAKGKEELSKLIPDFADAEAAVKQALNVYQQNCLLHVAKYPALVVAALGRNPSLLERLSKQDDQIYFGIAIKDLEASVKKKPTKAPPPEQKVRGSGSPSGADSQLEKLRAEADRTGDRTKVVEYLRKQREAKR